jgi:AcrR family transcriptional regulator
MAVEEPTGGNPPIRRMRAPERRAQLLEVARRVFGTSGFHAVSMDDVAKEAGITKPILYDHFSSKKNLYLALLDADLADLHDKVKEALDSPVGNRERIRRSFQAYFDFVDEQAEGFRLMMQETVGAETDFRERVERFRDQTLSEVADLIERESVGRLDRQGAEIVALALIGMVETVAQRGAGASHEQRAEAVDLLVQLAWRGITELSP